MTGKQAAVSALGRLISPVPVPGKGRAGLALARLAAHLSPEALCRPAPGVRLRVDLSDRIQALMWCGAYEPETTKIFRRLLIKGGIALDVGAHIGYFSLIAAALVGRTGEVHAFEPDPDCFAALSRNAASWSHVVPWNLAVAERSGTASLHRSAHQGESGWSSIVNGGDGAEGVEVCTVALDDWISRRALRGVDLLKIDAEGAEFRVLAGAKRILFDHRPALVFEANEACLAADGRRVGDLIELARSIGYGVWQVFSARCRPTGTLLSLHLDRQGVSPDPGLPGVRLQRVG